MYATHVSVDMWQRILLSISVYFINLYWNSTGVCVVAKPVLSLFVSSFSAFSLAYEISLYQELCSQSKLKVFRFMNYTHNLVTIFHYVLIKSNIAFL